MTSAWKELSNRDERAEGPPVAPDSQFEMFTLAPRSGADTELAPRDGGDTEPASRDGADAGAPQMVDSAGCSIGQDSDRRQRTDMMVTDGPPLRFLDVGGADPEELRRLEDSIRWLMNESSVRYHLPRAATLPPVRGLPPVQVNEGVDSLMLNPDRLFPPRPSSRRGGLARGVGKFLLASAVAAPTAYFIANWLQRVDTAAPSNTVMVAGTFEERIAAAAPVSQPAPSERAKVIDEILGGSTEPMAVRGVPPMEPRPAAVLDSNVVEVAAAPPPEVAAPAPEPAPSRAVAAGNPAPSSAVAESSPASGSAVAASSPPPSAAPPKSVLSAQEIATLVERGRVLFESGDLAAARLFFRRAANAGDAAAALAMGATYDPDVLAKRFVRGIGADLEEARAWYEKARELGSPEGPRRLETLLAQRR